MYAMMFSRTSDKLTGLSEEDLASLLAARTEIFAQCDADVRATREED